MVKRMDNAKKRKFSVLLKAQDSNTLFKTLKKNHKKCFDREEGSILSYVWYLGAIFVIAIVFSYSTFLADLFLIESTLNNSLHIAESASMAAPLTSSGFIEEDEMLVKLKIITASNPGSSSLNLYEKNQLEIVGKFFMNTLSEQLSISGATPTGGILKSRCTEDAKVRVTELIIYEPQYEVIKTREENPDAEEEEEPFEEKDIIFNIDYELDNTKWIKYTIVFSETNSYASAKKELLSSAPTLHDGRKAEGATMQAALGLQLKGVRDIFSKVSNGGTTDGDKIYAIQVTQAFDAVMASKDKRDVNH